MGRAVGETVAACGDYLYVKKNAVELARDELDRMSSDKRKGTLLLSSVTDPYQDPERKYLLTRGILQAAADVRYPGTIRILARTVNDERLSERFLQAAKESVMMVAVATLMDAALQTQKSPRFSGGLIKR